MPIVIAFLMDLAIGDPVYPLHPVRVMGRVIEKSESHLRRLWCSEKIAGGLLALVFPVLVFIFVSSLLFWLGKINFILAQVANILGIYTSVSIHDLKKEAQRLYVNLQNKDLESARSHLARIVGRDTRDLSSDEIVRATVETVAESTVDGIMAPLFYAALGGAPLALAYKAINTLDSMIGYMNERYRDFGFVAARQDYWANWVPARLSYVLIALAAFLIRPSTHGAWTVGWKDGVLLGENSSIPEATVAGALGVQLGGVNKYQGRLVYKPLLGASDRMLEPQIILESIRLMLVTSWLTLGLAFIVHQGALRLWA